MSCIPDGSGLRSLCDVLTSIKDQDLDFGYVFITDHDLDLPYSLRSRLESVCNTVYFLQIFV